MVAVEAVADCIAQRDAHAEHCRDHRGKLSHGGNPGSGLSASASGTGGNSGNAGNASGGGIYATAATAVKLSLQNALVQQNEAVGGVGFGGPRGVGGADGGNGGNNGSAFGGALFLAQNAGLKADTFQANLALAGSRPRWQCAKRRPRRPRRRGRRRRGLCPVRHHYGQLLHRQQQHCDGKRGGTGFWGYNHARFGRGGRRRCRRRPGDRRRNRDRVEFSCGVEYGAGRQLAARIITMRERR